MKRLVTIVALAVAFLSSSASGQCPNGRCQSPTYTYQYPAGTYIYPTAQATTTTYSYQYQSTTTVSGLDQVNAYRARAGLPPLAFDGYCDSLAATNNAGQARSRRVGHFVAGASCAAQAGSPGQAIAMWLASPAHAAILFSRSITRGSVRVENGYATFQAR